MRDFPIVAKFILNIILFAIYWILLSFVLGVLYGFGGQVFGYEIPLTGDLIYSKIALILLLLVFVLTVVFRKYFYISCGSHEEKVRKEEKKEGNNFETTL